jgi:hypothetical protein
MIRRGRTEEVDTELVSLRESWQNERARRFARRRPWSWVVSGDLGHLLRRGSREFCIEAHAALSR